MRPVHQIKHPTVGSRPNGYSKISDRGLQNQQPRSDDRRPCMGTLLPAENQLQIGNGVLYHIWTHRHSRAIVSASISIEHSRPHFALHDSLLQDKCILEFIFPISIQAMEPVAGDYCSCPNPWWLQDGAGQTFYLSFNLPLFEPHDHLVHSSQQCDNASEKAMHYIGRRRTTFGVIGSWRFFFQAAN